MRWPWQRSSQNPVTDSQSDITLPAPALIPEEFRVAPDLSTLDPALAAAHAGVELPLLRRISQPGGVAIWQAEIAHDVRWEWWRELANAIAGWQPLAIAFDAGDEIDEYEDYCEGLTGPLSLDHVGYAGVLDADRILRAQAATVKVTLNTASELSAVSTSEWPDEQPWHSDNTTRSQLRLTLVPAHHLSDTLAIIGWLGAINLLKVAELTSILRRWETRWSLVPAAIELSSETLHVVAGQPLTSQTETRQLLTEFAMISDEFYANSGPRRGWRLDYNTIAELSEPEIGQLMAVRSWSLWWD